MERIFNLFLFVEQNTIIELGSAVYEVEGLEHQKTDFLRQRATIDFRTCERFNLKTPLPWRNYQAMLRLGTNIEIFEGIFQHYGAPIDPLCVITPIVDNIPTFDINVGMGPLNLSELQSTPVSEPGIMADYLETYVTEGKFDLPKLINDDFFLAIKICFNNGKYVSSAKLLMSCLDTIAFIDSGDEKGNFKSWLKRYADLTRLGITEDELWELRNGLLHMTNVQSRKVRSGKVKPIILYVGHLNPPDVPKNDQNKYVNLHALLDVVVQALENWLRTYVDHPKKMVDFVKNYDIIVSDVRVSVFYSPQPA